MNGNVAMGIQHSKTFFIFYFSESDWFINASVWIEMVVKSPYSETTNRKETPRLQFITQELIFSMNLKYSVEHQSESKWLLKSLSSEYEWFISESVWIRIVKNPYPAKINKWKTLTMGIQCSMFIFIFSESEWFIGESL